MSVGTIYSWNIFFAEDAVAHFFRYECYNQICDETVFSPERDKLRFLFSIHIAAEIARDTSRLAISIKKGETATIGGTSRPKIIISLSDIRCWAYFLFFFAAPYCYHRSYFWATSSSYFRIETAATILTTVLALWTLLHPAVLMSSPSYYYSPISPTILLPLLYCVVYFSVHSQWSTTLHTIKV
jgi:hypothetical protein